MGAHKSQTNIMVVPPCATRSAMARLRGKQTGVSRQFLRDLQARTAPSWVVPFSQRAKEYKLREEYSNAPRYQLKVGNDTAYFESKGEMQGSALSARMLRRAKLQSSELSISSMLNEHVDPAVVSLVEDVLLLIIQLIRAREPVDKVLAITVFLKLRSGGSILNGVIGSIVAAASCVDELQLQSADEVLERITDLRSLISHWESIQNSSLVKQVSRVYRYAIALGVLQMVGVQIDENSAKAAAKELHSPLMGPNFMIALLDTVALFIQRSLLYAKSGSWETLFFGPKAFGTWFDACQKVKREYQFRGDLESQGTSYPQFMADVRKCIDEGKAILKFGDKASNVEMINIKRLLNEMLMLQADLSTYKEAQRSRRPPFSLLVHGKTCVGKSTFTSMLFQFAGKVLGLPTEDEFKYTRNSCDDFWSGWDSMKWFLLLDDVAYCNPDGKIQDRSLQEIIQIMNDVPLVPNQASLEDKGRNPMRARMCVATTNTKHLNAHSYFSCPVAVQRRFPFVLNVSPKRAYARDDDHDMINPAKLPAIVDSWPDFWNIEVERVVAVDEKSAKYELVKRFTNVHDFLAWLAGAMQDFEEIQSRAGAGVEAMRRLAVCRKCYKLDSMCTCVVPASAVPNVVDSDEEVAGEVLSVADSDEGVPELQVREYALPAYCEMGNSFTTRTMDGDITVEERFEYHESGEHNYIRLATYTDHHGRVRKVATPVRMVVGKQKPSLQASDIEMADVLAEIVARSAARCSSWTERAISWTIEKYLAVYCSSSVVRDWTHRAMEWRFARWAVKKVLLRTRDTRATAEWIGDLAHGGFLSPRWRRVLVGLGAVSAMVVAYGLFQRITSSKPKRPEDAEAAQDSLDRWEISTCSSVYSQEVQGLRLSVDDSAFPRTEKVNVWKRDDYQTSTFDRTDINASFADLPLEQVLKVVERNSARVKASDGVRAREGNAFSPGGHLWVVNNHTLFGETDLEITLSVMPHVQGASSNVTFKLRQSDIYRVPERDLAFFEVYSWETKRDLRKFIARPTLRGGYTATYVTRDKGIATHMNTVRCAQYSEVQVPELGITLPAWGGVADVPTVVGDCGSALVSHKPTSAILGLHLMGHGRQVWATAIDSVVVEQAYKHFDAPVIQCAVPVISAPSRKKVVGPLSQFSPLRWLERGTINCYGSYVGPRFTSRSKVRPTLLGEDILRARKWKVDFGAPQLRDWRPWRLALIDSTQKSFGAVSPGEMRMLADAFAADILDGLSSEALGVLEPLSDQATVNGIPGVRFIDKMNFKSSMGEPYNEAKKHHLTGVEGNMMFDAEVMERIAHIMDAYSRGQRAAPVFSGQLKDEPRPIPKIEKGQVRVFTAAPADWSFVVRKFLLPFVKVMQEHPFLFEASPGCVAQSKEWQAYFVHLTQFGADRLVAGDYGKFDKKMEALLILMAFRIIRKVLAAAGWGDDELVVVDCIAEDTAYAFVNFNGDLLEFSGSNPSGHPLTVIVNCLVNCLYMRLAFVRLCPFSGDAFSKARRFKEFVALLTYGDDNAMGVSKKADWFNHTAIQSVLKDIGVEYTMADKASESRAFIHIREVSYLKRSWRWDEDIGAVVCPLEEASIHKMLTICNPSETESPEMHMASVMSAAINEWFWYGREKFEAERAWILRLASDHNLMVELQHKGAPTWDELVERFNQASRDVVGADLGCENEHPRSLLPN